MKRQNLEMQLQIIRQEKESILGKLRAALSAGLSNDPQQNLVEASSIGESDSDLLENLPLLIKNFSQKVGSLETDVQSANTAKEVYFGIIKGILGKEQDFCQS